MFQFYVMKSKAERRLTKRLRRDNAQILADCNETDHPFYIFPTVVVVLILQYKDTFETFEFQYRRFLKQIHDFYVVNEIFLIQASECSYEDEATRLSVLDGFLNKTVGSAVCFDSILNTGMISSDDRTCIELCRNEVTAMKKTQHMRATLEFSMQYNQFRDVSYWQCKRLKTIRIRKQTKDPVFMYPKGLPLLKYCYGIDGGDPWTKLRIPGRY